MALGMHVLPGTLCVCVLVLEVNAWNYLWLTQDVTWFQGPSSGEASSTTSSAASDVKAAGGSAESASTSTDKNRNYAVAAGTIAALSGLAWYLLSKPKKSEEVVDWRGSCEWDLQMVCLISFTLVYFLRIDLDLLRGNNCWNVLCTTCSEAASSNFEVCTWDVL